MDYKIISNIKSLALDMISNASSGHPGICLDMAPLMYLLYKKYLKFSTDNSSWMNRDRFVLSAGHASALLYATLYMFGCNITLEDLKNYRKTNSNTPGYPEFGKTSGVEVTSGLSGQGLSTAVGMAIAEKKLNKENEFVDYNIYTLCGDGDLMEGISYEACSLAGTLKLDNLIVFYDSNKVSADGPLSKAFNENVRMRFESMGWYTDFVKDGSNILEIDKVLQRTFLKTKKTHQPIFIEIVNVIGEESNNRGTNLVHSGFLPEEDMVRIKKKLGMPLDLFYVDEKLRSKLIEDTKFRNKFNYEPWLDNYSKYEKNRKLLYDVGANKLDLLNGKSNYNTDKQKMTKLNNQIMKVISNTRNDFIGGSADSFLETNTYLTNVPDYNYINYDGSNIWYGVREQSMGAISNGLALSGFTPYCSTLLAFSDYLKPSIRMSALMNLNVTYIFTHDSINIGSDGVTYQPIEQLGALRSIPNLDVYRPADFNELLGSWNSMFNRQNPSALILSEMEVDVLDKTNTTEVDNGAYIVRRETGNIFAILIATGTEAATAIKIADQLYDESKVDIRVVSMPCMELFEEKDIKYKESILPKGYRKIVIEPSSSFGWEKYVYDQKYLITLDRFGMSASRDEVLKNMNFDYENIKERVIKLLF